MFTWNVANRINSEPQGTDYSHAAGKERFLWMSVPKWWKLLGAGVPAESIRSQPRESAPSITPSRPRMSTGSQNVGRSHYSD